jgi:DNA-binding NarL/FixJ family response regulator
MPIHRVLLVEDFCAFRRAVRMLLEQQPGFQVVGEAADGDEAIQLAARLLPDLILLDINLPTINGFQVVPEILRLSPSSRILFLTQEPSAEIAEEALRLGAHGYVVKTDAGSELLKALEAIRREERYLSRRLRAQMTGEALQRLGVTNRITLEDAETRVERAQRNQFPCAHEAQHYLQDDDFLASLQVCVSNALCAEDAVIVFATRSHQQALCDGLQEAGLEVNEEIRTGRLRLVDAEAAIAGYLNDEPADETRSRGEAQLLL